MIVQRWSRRSYPARVVCSRQIRVSVGATDKVTIGRSKPSPQSDRCDPSDAMVEFEFVVLNDPNVKSGRYWNPPINWSAVDEKPSVAGSNVCAGSRYSPKREKLTLVSNSVFSLNAAV